MAPSYTFHKAQGLNLGRWSKGCGLSSFHIAAHMNYHQVSESPCHSLIPHSASTLPLTKDSRPSYFAPEGDFILPSPTVPQKSAHPGPADPVCDSPMGSSHISTWWDDVKEQGSSCPAIIIILLCRCGSRHQHLLQGVCTGGLARARGGGVLRGWFPSCSHPITYK